MHPGEILIDDDAAPITANKGRASVPLVVRHTGDRPIQVGSHFHFFEVNWALRFDRQAAYGMRLNIPAGTAVRFEPGEDKEVSLTEFAGERVMMGGNALVQGALDAPGVSDAAAARIAAREILHASEAQTSGEKQP